MHVWNLWGAVPRKRLRTTAKYGVLQGSCLGPLLFLEYINDLSLSLKSLNVNMYADDNVISVFSNSIYITKQCCK